jgi:hypothetical protein
MGRCYGQTRFAIDNSRYVQNILSHGNTKNPPRRQKIIDYFKKELSPYFPGITLIASKTQ